MRNAMICLVASAMMLTTGLAGVVTAATPTDTLPLSEQLALVNEFARRTVERQDANLGLPLEAQYLPPLTREDANLRAKLVLADAITPLSLARAIEAMGAGDGSETVAEVDLVALNVMAYYATVGYESDPEFGAISQDRIKRAVELLAATGWNPQQIMPKATPNTPPAVEEVTAFVDGLMRFDSAGVQTFAPSGQELGRDTSIIEQDYLSTLDAYVTSYRTTGTVSEDQYSSTWSSGYSYPYWASSYSYAYDWWDYVVYGYRSETRYVNYNEYHEEYRSLYRSTMSVSEFQRAIEMQDYRELFLQIEHVTGIASFPFAATSTNSQANPEAVLLGTVVIPFAFDDSWWSTVLKFDQDESIYSSMSYVDSLTGSYSFYHYYSTTYYQYVWGYESVYHRHWYVVCSWWSCYWTYYWHYHGTNYYSYWNYLGGSSYTNSGGGPINSYYSSSQTSRYSSDVHTSVQDIGGSIAEMAGVIVATEGSITIEVPAKQYSLLARESTLRDDVSSRTGLGGGDSLVAFEGVGALPTQLATTRYDEQCRESFVMAPTPNDCELLVDEDAAAASADGSDAEASANAAAEDADAAAMAAAETAEGIVADPEAFVNALVASVPPVPEPTVPQVPEPTVPAIPEPTVPEVPEPTVPTLPEPPAVPAVPELPGPPNPPAAPELSEIVHPIVAVAAEVAGTVQGIVADPEGFAAAREAEAEAFAAAREAEARAVTVVTPGQAVDTLTVANVEKITVSFQVAEFTSGAAYVVSLGLVAKEGLTAIDPEDILVKITGRGVAGESPTLEYSQDTPCYESRLTGDGGAAYFPGIPDTTPGECIRESDAGEGAVFRLLHAIDLDGGQLFTGIDAETVNVGETADAAVASIPAPPAVPEAPEVPEVPETPALPPMPPA